MKIALPSPHRFDDNVEQLWKILPNGLRELVCEEDKRGGGIGNQLHDLHRIYTEFIPRCEQLMIKDATYDWNLIRGIDAAFIIASDLYLEGKMHQAVHMVFLAASLRELISDAKNSYKDMTRAIKTESVLIILFSRFLPHLYHAAVNTRTTKLLRDFLDDVCPCEVWRRKLLNSTAEDRPLFKYKKSNDIRNLKPKRKLITLFCELWCDYYQEYPFCEDSTLLQLFNLWMGILKGHLDGIEAIRKEFILHRPSDKLMSTIMICVNGDAKYSVSICAQISLKQLGIKEGDTIKCEAGAKNKTNDDNREEGADDSVLCNPIKPAAKQRNGKKKRRHKSSPVSSLDNQEPSNQQLKEAHSKMMEPVLNEMRPQLRRIRQQLNSIRLHRQLPKQRKGLKVISSNVQDNFNNKVATFEAKAGKIAYPILVGQVSNLYSSSKASRGRKAHIRKIISLDLHGLSKKQALDALKANLPRWVDTAMKGDYPWVIPIDVICGGGIQALSEVVAAFIRNEQQVANRPKGYFM